MRFVTVFMLLCMWTMVENVTESDMELLLVQVIWRHGDRSPTKTFPTDPFQETYWTFGGGGFGQLSPISYYMERFQSTIYAGRCNRSIFFFLGYSDRPSTVFFIRELGMKQHMNLGKLIRKTYIDDMNFLSRRYSSKEIYVRSTDLNRTLISAMANILGMYGPKNNFAVPDLDYPDDDGWPAGFVPVAVHTVQHATDYVLNPTTNCTRHMHLWKMAKSSPEVQTFVNRPDVAGLLANLTAYCGLPVDIDNLWIIRDALLIEQIHANDTLRRVNLWFDDEIFEWMTAVNDQVLLFQNGIFNKTLIMNNLDVGNELQKIRGGPLFNDINMHMNIKLECLNKTSSGCKWINGLKYYAYSAHDTTVYAFLSILGIQSKVIVSSGYPDFSAAAFIELWINKTENKPYFKLKYHQSEGNATLYPVTQFIAPCEGQLYCDLDVFRKFAERTRPDRPMNEWCNVDPRPLVSSSSSSWKLLKDTITWLGRFTPHLFA